MTNSQTLLGALKRAETVLTLAYDTGYIDRGDFCDAMQIARVAITACESRSQSGVTEEMVEAAVEEVRKAKAANVWDRWTDHDAVRAMLSAALATPTPPVSEEYLREVLAEEVERLGMVMAADGYRRNKPMFARDAQAIFAAMRRVSQPPADGRDDVLELAANTLESIAPPFNAERQEGYDWLREKAAKKIRALKSNTTDTVIAGAGTLK